MVKRIITEISEEDFRKLDLKGYKTERVEHENGHRYEMVECSLNDVLDEQIQYCLESGCEVDFNDLQIPVTFAIHEPPTEKDYEKVAKTFKGLNEEERRDFCLRTCSYLYKYINQFTGPRSFQIGCGIKHLYSTRDYYEAHDDYWRVRKDETKVIYRVHLSQKWLDRFVLKYKKEVEQISPNEYIETHYHLNSQTNECEEIYRCLVKKEGACTAISPVKKEEKIIN